jgi:glucosamine-6-phosphate deaminase
MGAKTLVCTVPGKTKAQAVRDMLLGPIATPCPASILRVHADCALYLDPDSAELFVHDKQGK